METAPPMPYPGDGQSQLASRRGCFGTNEPSSSDLNSRSRVSHRDCRGDQKTEIFFLSLFCFYRASLLNSSGNMDNNLEKSSIDRCLSTTFYPHPEATWFTSYWSPPALYSDRICRPGLPVSPNRLKSMDFGWLKVVLPLCRKKT